MIVTTTSIGDKEVYEGISIETHHWADNQSQAEECFERGESCAHRIGKFFGDDREAWGEKSRISERLDDSDNECEGNEHPVTWNTIEQPKQDCRCAGGEDAAIKHNLQSRFYFA